MEEKKKLEESIKFKVKRIDVLRHQEKVDEDKITGIIEEINTEIIGLDALYQEEIDKEKEKEAVTVNEKLNQIRTIARIEQDKLDRITSLFDNEKVDQQNLLNDYTEKVQNEMAQTKATTVHLEKDIKQIKSIDLRHQKVLNDIRTNELEQKPFEEMMEMVEANQQRFIEENQKLLPGNMDEVQDAYDIAILRQKELEDYEKELATVVNFDKTQYEAELKEEQIKNNMEVNKNKELILLNEVFELFNQKPATFEELKEQNEKIARLLYNRYSIITTLPRQAGMNTNDMFMDIVRVRNLTQDVDEQIGLRKEAKSLNKKLKNSNKRIQKLRDVSGTFKMNVEEVHEEAININKGEIEAEKAKIDQIDVHFDHREALKENEKFNAKIEAEKAAVTNNDVALAHTEAQKANQDIEIANTTKADIELAHAEGLIDNKALDAKVQQIDPKFAVSNVAEPSDELKKASPKKFPKWKVALTAIIAAVAVGVVTYMPAIKEIKEKLTGNAPQKDIEANVEQEAPVLGFNNEKQMLTVDELGNIEKETVAVEEKTSVKEEKTETPERSAINIQYLRPGAMVDIKADSYSYAGHADNGQVSEKINDGKEGKLWLHSIVVIDKDGKAIGFTNEHDQKVEQIIKEAQEKNPNINVNNARAVGFLSENTPELGKSAGRGAGHWVDLGEYATNYDNSAINTIAAEDKVIDVDALEAAKQAAKDMDAEAQELIAENEAKVKGMGK